MSLGVARSLRDLECESVPVSPGTNRPLVNVTVPGLVVDQIDPADSGLADHIPQACPGLANNKVITTSQIYNKPV